MGSKYSIGLDFGTESGRAVLVDVRTGQEVATAVYRYANGVIDEVLPCAPAGTAAGGGRSGGVGTAGGAEPGAGVRLPPDFALQDPEDYLRTLGATIPAMLSESGVSPCDVVGLGIDFTSCTMLPTYGDGMPLCMDERFRRNPHAWVKLWKHHAAQPEANALNRVARERGETFLARYGGKISSEWFFPKVWQILNDAPEVYAAAERIIEGADWIVWQLTGVETRNSCTAGYKAIWDKRAGFPGDEFFRALDPRLEHVIDEKMKREITPLGVKAGGLTPAMAERTGLLPGTPVAVANVDAHVAVPAATVVGPGKMVMIMGTSICHMVLGTRPALVEGMCGVVEDGILPGLHGFEAGQSAVGDIFAWFIDNCVPGAYERAADKAGTSVHGYLERKAADVGVGQSGLLALDWWNGNRSILVDADLTGLLLGCTLNTKPEEIYRALIEATACGTATIINAMNRAGVPVEELYACGGLPERNRLLMQIFSDVTGLEIKVSRSSQTSALGSAMFGAVAAGKAAGGHDTIVEAAAAMAGLKDEGFRPDAANHRHYRKLLEEYTQLHDLFGRGSNDVMKRLKAIKAESLTG